MANSFTINKIIEFFFMYFNVANIMFLFAAKSRAFLPYKYTSVSFSRWYNM